MDQASTAVAPDSGTFAPNDRLADVMSEAELSRKALARLIRLVAAEHHDQVPCNHTTVGRWMAGAQPRRKMAGYIAEALSRRLGRRVTFADLGLAAAIPVDPSLGLSYAVEAAPGVDMLGRLLLADLDEANAVLTGSVSPAAWNEASLGWLLNAGRRLDVDGVPRSSRVGLGDVTRLKATTTAFAQLDDQFGGGHARRALIGFLNSDVRQLLTGSYREAVGRELFSAAAEATLLAAWMSYDAGLHRLAQRYFIQALGLAQGGGDRLLGGSILDAMSHQATFLARLPEAANLAGSARLGVQRDATATLLAHFHAMEARALARLGDRRGCDLALAEAVREFERRRPEDDPAWIGYFDDAELAAEFGHCFRDLGRADAATGYVNQSLNQTPDSSPRSTFFARLVLATTRLEAGDLDEACAVARTAIEQGEVIKSARCVTYLADFRFRLTKHVGSPVVRDLAESVADSSLWQLSA